MLLQTYISFCFNLLQTNTADGNNSQGSYGVNLPNISLADGYGANQADLVWEDERSLAASSSDEFDLYSSLTDKFGNAVNFAKVKGLIIVNTSSTQSLTVGASASNGWATMLAASGLIIGKKAGGNPSFFANFNAAGATVTSGTGDKLTVANGSGGTATYKIIIFGTSV